MASTPSFVLEMKLNTSLNDDDVLNRRFFCAFLMQNRLIRHAQNCIRSLRQDNTYRSLMEQRRSCTGNSPAEKKERTAINMALKDLRMQHGLSEYQFHAWIALQQHRYRNYIDSMTAQKIATHVWQATEKVLFSNGKTIHFRKAESVCSMEGKSNASGMRFKDGRLHWLGLKIQPQYRKGDVCMREALKHRVKYCRLVRKAVGGRWHYYLQLVLEGMPPQKHRYMDGRVGIDPGVSCEAIVSDSGCLLTEIRPADPIIAEKRRLQRKLDRSRRATNPGRYNPDGTVKRQRGRWVMSKTYKHTQMKLKSLQRRNAAALSQHENELANLVLEQHGTDIFVEKMSYAALQRKAKESHVNEKTGRHASRKRFGGSIAGHAPARFLLKLEQRLSYIGKTLNEVDTWKFKASQYDHVVGDYVKPGLSERWKDIGGRTVQRDLYSAFLLQHAATPQMPDREACEKDFHSFMEHHDACIEKMKQAGISKKSVFGF